MSYGTDGLNAYELPRDANQNPIQAGSELRIVKDTMTGAGGAGDTFSIAVPDGAIVAEVYVIDSSNALLGHTLNDNQGSPVGAYRPTALGSKVFGCSGQATITGSCSTADLADAATATAVAIFQMGKSR